MNVDESWKSLRILSKPKRNSKQFQCHSKELREWMKDAKDLEVVPIAIAGPSRRGKSFIFNYFIRFLLYIQSHEDPNGWMGRKNDKLKGFSWKASVEPETEGIWMSKPFILKRSDGSDIAIVLLDTQGVFDNHTNEREWSTIVGISLLISSTLIFNLFSNIQEDSIVFLESFLEYGIKASKKLSKDENSKPFQNLMFLIRDWEIPMEYSYGLSGGNNYLERTLKLEEGQSERGIHCRELIRECFSTVECFLMPKIGDKILLSEFNGSHGQLADDFKAKLKILVPHLLDPDNVQVKSINGSPLLGKEFISLLENLVNVFNQEDFTDYLEIKLLGATSRIADKINLRRIKNLHFNELKQKIEEKPFISRQKLIKQNKELSDRYIREFEDEMIADDDSIIKEMESAFEENCEHFYNENEIRRSRYIAEVLEKCKNEYSFLSDEAMTLGIECESLEFDIKLNHFETNVLNKYEAIYQDEKEEVFLKDKSDLIKFISTKNQELKNKRREKITTIEIDQTKLLETSLEIYGDSMKSFLRNQPYITDSEFKAKERKTFEKIVNDFDKNMNGKPSDKYFKLQIELKKLKKSFKEQNQIKTENLRVDLEIQVKSYVDKYKLSVDQLLYLIYTEEDLLYYHRINKKKFSEEFLNNNEHIRYEFMELFHDKFNSEIDILYERFQTDIEKKKQYYENAYTMSFENFKKKTEEYSPTKWTDYKEESERFVRVWRINACDLYENYFKEPNTSLTLKNQYGLKLSRDLDKFSEIFAHNLSQKITDMNNLVEVEQERLSNKFVRKFDLLNTTSKSLEEIEIEMSEKLEQTLNKFKKNVQSKVDEHFFEYAKQRFEKIIYNLFQMKMSEMKKARMEKIDIDTKIEINFNKYCQEIECLASSLENMNVEMLSNENEKLKKEILFSFEKEISNVSIHEVEELVQNLSFRMNEFFKKFMQAVQEILFHIKNSVLAYRELLREIENENFNEIDLQFRNKQRENFKKNNFQLSVILLQKFQEFLDSEFDKELESITKKQEANESEKEKFIDSKMTELLIEYKKDLKSLFKNGPNDIEPKESKIRGRLTLNLKESLNQYHLKFKESNIKEFLLRLTAKFDKIFNELKEINLNIRQNSIDNLEKECEIAIENYEVDMEKQVEIMKTEEEFKNFHCTLVTSKIGLIEDLGFSDKVIFKNQIEKTRNKMEELKKHYEDILKEKLHDAYIDKIESMRSNYNREMHQNMNIETNLDQGKIKKYHIHTIEKMKQNFNLDFKIDFDFNISDYYHRIDRILNKEYDQILNSFENHKSEEVNKMQERIKSLKKLYEEEFGATENKMKFETENELIELHKVLVEKYVQTLNNEFKESEIEAIEISRQILKIDVQEIFESSFLKLWKIDEIMRKASIDNLRSKSSMFYQEEMKRYLKEKIYFQEEEILNIHSKASKKTMEMFEKMFEDLPKKHLH